MLLCGNVDANMITAKLAEFVPAAWLTGERKFRGQSRRNLHGFREIRLTTDGERAKRDWLNGTGDDRGVVFDFLKGRTGEPLPNGEAKVRVAPMLWRGLPTAPPLRSQIGTVGGSGGPPTTCLHQRLDFLAGSGTVERGICPRAPLDTFPQTAQRAGNRFMLPLPELDFRRTPVTLIIAAVAVALEVVCTLDEVAHDFDQARRLQLYNEMFGILPRIWTGQVWRPFTSTLLHGGFFHAAFNLYWLLKFGTVLELRFGSYRTLGLIVLFGYVTMLPQFVVSNFALLDYDALLPAFIRERFIPQPGPLVAVWGLSGVIYGLFGILLIGRRWHRDLEAVCDSGTVRLLLFWFVLCFALTYAGMLPVANIAHGAGLAFGVLYGMAIFAPKARIRWMVGATLATLAVLALMIP